MTGKVLVTGAAGFIGSTLVDRLLLHGYSVIGIDSYDPFYDRKIKERNLTSAGDNKNFLMLEGDIRDAGLLKRVFQDHSIGLVIHLAAKAGVRPSIVDPKDYYSVNVNGTLSILEVMKEHGTRKLIFASSSSIYGNNKKVPFSETDFVDRPISPYAASKQAAELLCHTYHHLYGFDIFSLRLFTVFGPRQRPDLAIHKFANMILGGEPITVYGDGSSSRDYTYIDDIIDGIESGINNLEGFEIINLGGGDPVTLEKLIHTLEKQLGKKASWRHLPSQAGDVDLTFADITKAKKLLSYYPKVTFDTGVCEFIKWKRSS